MQLPIDDIAPQTLPKKRQKTVVELDLQHLVQHKTRFTAPKERVSNREHCWRLLLHTPTISLKCHNIMTRAQCFKPNGFMPRQMIIY